MNNVLPDFSEHGYRLVRELSHNRVGGRVTYLATDLRADQKVVIKQFQFAKLGANWSDFDTYDREILTLKGLEHSGVPKYLDSFQNSDGFCMVQEYKNATSLANPKSFEPTEIRKIAIALLDILVYLQGRMPPVIHRDIKPENILVDADLNVYLVDFGFARLGHGEVGVSSVVKGTLGFMPPEQIFNRQLTEASDLYGLGITLICLLTATKSGDVGELIDITYRVNFKRLSSKLSPLWIRWLEKMVEPRLQDRYANALEARAALPDALILPEATFSVSSLELTAVRQSQCLMQTITLRNTVPHTVLEGRWEIAPHPNDPNHLPGYHPWILIEPRTFKSNHVDCQVSVDTSKLMSGNMYTRQLQLHTNAIPKTYTVNLTLQTAPIPARAKKNPYGVLALLLGFTVVTIWFTLWIAILICTLMGSAAAALFSAAAGASIGLLIAAWLLNNSGLRTGGKAAITASAGLGIMTLFLALTFSGKAVLMSLVSGVGIGVFGGCALGLAMGMGVEQLFRLRFTAHFSVMAAVLTIAWGTSLGLGLILTFMNPFVVFATILTGMPLLGTLLQMPLKRVRFMTEYRRSERHLIKP